MLRLHLALLLCLVPLCMGEESCPGGAGEPALQPPPRHYNILLLGATGDLAQKYLWSGLFTLFRRHYVKGETAFQIYACGTTKPEVGRNKLSEILIQVIKCKAEDAECRKLKGEFVSFTQYHQTKTAEHYQKLADKINENSLSLYGLQDSAVTSEAGRLVYLSIPPSQYTKATKHIHQHLRPNRGRPWFRIVLEKPFGYDRPSAVKLARHLGAMYREEEVYRVDHYLGKPLVKNILPFRQANRDLYEPIWNRDHIERVEVVMKETLDCKGRTEFYNEVGVIRDVMQNHLTELLALVAMELPERDANINTILGNKHQVLKDVLPLDVSSTVIGQYETFATEVMIESNRTDSDNYQEKQGGETVTRTPTFAASVLSINNPRWRGVPFVVMSGKKLDEKASYIRVVFKHKNRICLAKNDPKCGADANPAGQMVFLIGSNDVKLPPMISVSKSLLGRSEDNKPRGTLGWKLADWGNNEFVLLGEASNAAYHVIADSHSQPDAYTTLIEAVYEAQRHLFTNTDTLLASWDVWSGLVETYHGAYSGAAVRKYVGGAVDSHLLDVQVFGKRMEYVIAGNEDGLISHVIEEDSTANQMGQIPPQFRGQRLVVQPLDRLMALLAAALESSALNAVSERGSFHVAFPGGVSPRPLLGHLAHRAPGFPWKHTHIWQVDERCVESNSRDSNLRSQQDYLLNHISIPFSNIHVMPVHLLTDLCDSKYNGDLLYETVIRRHVLNATLDFIVLGMGQDGHTASLFPNEGDILHIDVNHNGDSIDDTKTDTKEAAPKLIAFTEVRNSKVVSPRRLTMTFALINSARNVSVIVTGRGKHGVLGRVGAAEEGGADELPVTRVRARRGDVTWYVDYDAYFG